MDAATTIRQRRTVETAHRHGASWTQTEIDRLLELAQTEGNLETVARKLGRTLFAVMTAHSLAVRGQLVASDARDPYSTANAYRGWTITYGGEGYAR